MSLPEVVPGSLLVSAPTLRDPNFQRTVVFMIHHDEHGSLGLVVNRPTEVPMSEVFPAADGVLHQGGPVGTGDIMLLHRLGDRVEGSRRVMPGVWFGGEVDSLREAIAESDQPATSWRAYLGYSGWGAGQLAAELATGSWLVCPGKPSYLFDLPPDEVWAQVLRDQGGEHELLIHMPLDPSQN